MVVSLTLNWPGTFMSTWKLIGTYLESGEIMSSERRGMGFIFHMLCPGYCRLLTLLPVRETFTLLVMIMLK